MDASREYAERMRRFALKRKIEVDGIETSDSKVPRLGETVALEVVADAAIADWGESDDGNAEDDEDLLELKIKTGDPSADYDALFDMVDPIEAAIFEFQETADEADKKKEASNEYGEKSENEDGKPYVSSSAATVSRIC